MIDLDLILILPKIICMNIMIRINMVHILKIRHKVLKEKWKMMMGENKNGFIIHNVLGQGGDELPEPPHNNPQTGSNIILYLITLLISIIGFVSGKLYLKNSN